MRAAGIRRYSGPVEPLELPGPGEPLPDEVLVEVRCCGVGNWDDIARTGGWDLGRQPPMALGVEAAGVVARAGGAVTGFAAGTISVAVRDPFPLEHAADALACLRQGTNGQAVVLQAG